MSNKHLNIISISAEVAPFSKAGGLADVARSLPKALKRLGHNLIVITPLYGVIDLKKKRLKLELEKIPLSNHQQENLGSFKVYKGYLMPGLPIYFIDRPEYFSSQKTIYGSRQNPKRFCYFNYAALALIKFLKLQPNIIHCHDWHAGLIPYLIKKNDNAAYFKKTKVLFTIHNLSYQGGQLARKHLDDGKSALANLDWEKINFMKRGIIWADIINTVSETYAKEILEPAYGEGLWRILRSSHSKLYGIVNGIDYLDFNPKKDKYVRYKYDLSSLEIKEKNKIYLQKIADLPTRADAPLVGMVSRIAEHKGFDLIIEIAPEIFKLDLQLILVGYGEANYERFLRRLDKKYKEFSACLEFDVRRASEIYAGSDIFLMPSRFEPCGLGQLISLRYGSVPVVRATGGLLDTVRDYDPKTGEGNGFVFKSYDAVEMLIALARAVENYKYKKSWQNLVKNGMQAAHSWQAPAKKYEALYRKVLQNA